MVTRDAVHLKPLTALATCVPRKKRCRGPMLTALRSRTYAMTHLFTLETAPCWADSVCAGLPEPDACAFVSRSAVASCAAMALCTGEVLPV